MPCHIWLVIRILHHHLSFKVAIVLLLAHPLALQQEEVDIEWVQLGALKNKRSFRLLPAERMELRR